MRVKRIISRAALLTVSGCCLFQTVPVLADAPWPRFQGDHGSTGLSRYTGPQTANVKWVIEIGTWCGSAAVGPDGTIYFGDDMSRFRAVNPDGTVEWTFRLPASDPPPGISPEEEQEWREFGIGAGFATFAPALASDGTIYIGSTFHPWPEPPEDAELGLYALNPDGTRKWFFETNAYTNSSPNIGEDGTVYFIAGTTVYAVDPDGNLKWSHALESGGVRWCTPALADDGTVYVTGESLLALGPDGTLKWSYAGPGGAGINGFAAHPTVGGDGSVYFGAESLFYAVNPDGSEKWTVVLGWTESSPAVGPDGTLYIGTGTNQAFHALDPDDGTVKWSYPLRKAVDSSPVVGADGTVYFGTDEGWFYALSPDGSLKWRLDVGASGQEYPGEIDTAPAIGSDGTLYVGHAGGPGEPELLFYAIGD